MRRGLLPSREEARERIRAGRVTVGGAFASKPGRLVAPNESVELLDPPARFVSRAGDKLAAALDRFGIDVRDRRVLDAGASTGGFTDCLLQRGARHVIAVDVGHGQLDDGLRVDPRVEVRERTNVRTLALADIGEPVDLVTADLSFISLRLVLDALLGAAGDDADLVLLVKPQFEAGRTEADRARGVIRDPDIWRRVLHEIIAALTGRGASIMGVMPSPRPGASGNIEFLVHARRTSP